MPEKIIKTIAISTKVTLMFVIDIFQKIIAKYTTPINCLFECAYLIKAQFRSVAVFRTDQGKFCSNWSFFNFTTKKFLKKIFVNIKFFKTEKILNLHSAGE